MASVLVRKSSQTTTLETGNKISDNNNSAGQVKHLPSDCCFKENGIFAIVPNELLTDGNARNFLPKESHLRRKAAIEQVRIDDSITVICESGERHPIVELLRKSLCSDVGTMGVYIDGGRLFVVASEKGRALFANSFAVGSDEDVLYYMLAVCEHIGFDVSRTEVMGLSEVPEVVRKYFEVIQVSQVNRSRKI